LKLRPQHFELDRVVSDYDFLEQAFKRAGVNRPSACAGLHKFPRAQFSVQIIKQPYREAHLGLTVRLLQKYEISAPLKDLLARGFDLRGCWVFDPRQDGREKWLGPIKGVQDSWAVITREHDEVRLSKSLCEHQIEARKDTIRKLLLHCLVDGHSDP
jgi:hypothetical protein